MQGYGQTCLATPIRTCQTAGMATILPYTTRPAVCRDYNPRAAGVAAQIAGLVAAHLPHVAVEHVGSTSVPGCAGKGIVDLMKRQIVASGVTDSLDYCYAKAEFVQEMLGNAVSRSNHV